MSYTGSNCGQQFSMQDKAPYLLELCGSNPKDRICQKFKKKKLQILSQPLETQKEPRGATKQKISRTVS
jgi:hypothetical protein